MKRLPSQCGRLFLFSGLDPRQGGVQVSALDLISERSSSQDDAIIYGSDPQNACSEFGRVVCEKDKLRLLGQVLLRQWPVATGVFWHLDMLKLLPFLRGFRGKIVVFLHGIEAWRPQTPRMQKMLKRVDLFLSNSEHTWQRFLEFTPAVSGSRHTTTALGYGQPIPNFAVQKAPSPVALILGRMAKSEDYKGHKELIAAWPKVVASVPNARLEIVGEGDLQPELEHTVAEKNLTGRVIFHGRVTEERKQELLSTCSVMAMPSRAEGFGIVYLEAMRLGRPCLVSNCDAGREVVSPPIAGLEVDPRNESEMAAKLVELLTFNQRWTEWSKSATERYSTSYTRRDFQDRVFNAIDSVHASIH